MTPAKKTKAKRVVESATDKSSPPFKRGCPAQDHVDILYMGNYLKWESHDLQGGFVRTALRVSPIEVHTQECIIILQIMLCALIVACSCPGQSRCAFGGEGGVNQPNISPFKLGRGATNGTHQKGKLPFGTLQDPARSRVPC